MLKTIFSRVTQTIVVVFLLVTFVFFAVRAIPGNPFASEKALAPEEHAPPGRELFHLRMGFPESHEPRRKQK